MSEDRAVTAQHNAQGEQGPPSNVAGIVALCMGVASFIVTPAPLVATFAVTAGIVGCAMARQNKGMREGMAVGGLVLGLLGYGAWLFATFVLPFYVR